MAGLPLHLLVRKFVLLIGDEGAVLVHVVRGNVKNAWFVPVDSEEGPEAIREFLKTDKRAPLIVEADVIEQLYREELLPKTNPIDHPKILKRRLELAFVSEEMKAAIPLNKKGPGGQKVFLFMALPTNDWLKKWVDFLATVSNPVEAFALLPMESLGLVEALAPPVEVQGEKHWRIFVSQEVTGGFRQIIQLNGQFILTRMTPKPAEEDTPEDVSQLIEREFKSSIGYIKRLGYLEADHLDLVAVVGDPIREELFERDFSVTSLSILTPFEAGQRLGYEKVADPESPYGDMLHAVWLARKSKAPILLSTPAMKKRRQMRQVEKVVPAVAALVTIAQLYVGSDTILANMEMEDAIAGREVVLSERKQQLERIEQELGASEFPHDLMKDRLGAVEALQAKQVDWPGMLQNIDKALEGSAIILGFNLEVDKDIFEGKPPAKGGKKNASLADGVPYRIELQVVFLETPIELAAFVDKVNALEKRFREVFPETAIEVGNLPTNIRSSGEFSSTGKNIDWKKIKDLVITYVIRNEG